MAFHDALDAEVPGLQNELVNAWGRQRLQYKTHGKIIRLSANPATRVTRGMKKAIRSAVAWKADQEAEAWAKEHSLKLITDLDNTSRDAVRLLMKHLKTGSMSASEVNRLVGEIVGLTPQQSNTVRSLYEQGKPFHEIERHMKGLLESRGRMVAHNEMMLAGNMGLQLAYEKALTTELIKPASRKVWRTVSDGRVCAICSAMNRRQAKIDGVFRNGLKTPPAHPGCRCFMTLNIAS